MVHSPEHESYYIDPKPILTVANFKEATVSESNGSSELTVKLDKIGQMQFGIATEKCNGKKLAFVIRDRLVMASTLIGKIDGGSFQVTGGFEKQELEDSWNR